MKRFALLVFGLTSLARIAGAETSAPQNDSVLRAFFDAIVDLKIIFSEVASLGGGVGHGQVWVANLRTAEQRRITQANDLSWPVMAPDGQTLFALRGRQLVRCQLTDEVQTAIGGEVEWRELIGVRADYTVFGFVAGTPSARAAMMTAAGDLLLFPQPASDEEQLKQSLLLQENRAYTNGRVLRVLRSSREGSGFDVFMEAGGAKRNVSNCGNDFCGQPSLSPDGLNVLYVHAARR